MRTTSTVLSFRVDSKIAAGLSELAKQQHITIAALLAMIVTSYVEWESFAPKVGMIPLQKETVKLMLETMTDVQVKEIAAIAAAKFQDAILLMTGQLSLAGFLNVIRIKLEKSGFALNKLESENETQLVVQHGMGLKWSVLFSTFCSTIVNKLGFPAKTEVREDMWVIRIDMKKQGIIQTPTRS